MTVGSIFRGVEVGHRALDYHLERANVLAGNVANIDTPGFRPRELVRPSEARTDTHLRMTVSSAEHLAFPRAHAPGAPMSAPEPVRDAAKVTAAPGGAPVTRRVQSSPRTGGSTARVGGGPAMSAKGAGPGSWHAVMAMRVML